MTDRFGHQIFLAEEDSSCCFRQCFESLRGFEMKLMDRQGKVAVVIDRPMRQRAIFLSSVCLLNLSVGDFIRN